MSTVSDKLIRLPFYGVHEDPDGIRHVYQDITPDGWNYIGLRQPAGGSVRHLKRTCPHNIVPTLGLRPVSQRHWQQFVPLLDDPLVDAMLPVPRDPNVYFLPDTQLPQAAEYLSCLLRLASPFAQCMYGYTSGAHSKALKDLNLTNIAPLVLLDAQGEDVDRLRTLCSAALATPRTLVVTGSPEMILPPHVVRLETHLADTPLPELIALPMEHIGACLLAQYCRRESLGSPLSR